MDKRLPQDRSAQEDKDDIHHHLQKCHQRKLMDPIRQLDNLTEQGTGTDFWYPRNTFSQLDMINKLMKSPNQCMDCMSLQDMGIEFQTMFVQDKNIQQDT